MHKPDEIAARFLGSTYETLDERAKRVAQHVAGRTHITRNVAKDFEATSLGQRAADAVASFGGSWTFVALFAATMLVWVLLNAFLLMTRGKTFDPYPFILLNWGFRGASDAAGDADREEREADLRSRPIPWPPGNSRADLVTALTLYGRVQTTVPRPRILFNSKPH